MRLLHPVPSQGCNFGTMCTRDSRAHNPRQGGPRAEPSSCVFFSWCFCLCVRSVFCPSVNFSIFVISGLRVPSCGAPSCVVPSRDAAAVSAAADIKCTYGLGACDCSGGVLGLATTNLQRSTSSSAKKTERNRIKMPRSTNEPRKERVFKYAERAKKGVSCLFGLEMHSSQVVVWAQRNTSQRTWCSVRRSCACHSIWLLASATWTLVVGPVVCLCTFHIFRSDLVTFHNRFSSPEPISLTMETLRCCCTAKFTRLHSSGRPDTKGTLWASRVQTRQRKTKDTTKLQAIAAVAATVFHWVIRLLLLTEREKFRSCDRSRQRQSRNKQCTCTRETFFLHFINLVARVLHFMTLVGRVVIYVGFRVYPTRATIFFDTRVVDSTGLDANGTAAAALPVLFTCCGFRWSRCQRNRCSRTS